MEDPRTIRCLSEHNFAQEWYQWGSRALCDIIKVPLAFCQNLMLHHTFHSFRSEDKNKSNTWVLSQPWESYHYPLWHHRKQPNDFSHLLGVHWLARDAFLTKRHAKSDFRIIFNGSGTPACFWPTLLDVSLHECSNCKQPCYINRSGRPGFFWTLSAAWMSIEGVALFSDAVLLQQRQNWTNTFWVFFVITAPFFSVK